MNRRFIIARSEIIEHAARGVHAVVHAVIILIVIVAVTLLLGFLGAFLGLAAQALGLTFLKRARKRLHRHGNVFAPVGGRTRRTGEQRHPTRSRDAPHALHHPFDIGLEGLVVESLHLRLEPLHRTDMPQVVAVAELREASPAQQLPEHPRLRLDRTAAKTVDGPLALREPGGVEYVVK